MKSLNATSTAFPLQSFTYRNRPFIEAYHNVFKVFNLIMRAIAFLVGGNIFAQSLSFAIMPIVARLFGPEAMGIAGTFAALAAICTQIAAASYPLAIVLPKDDSDAAAITSLSLIIAFFTSSTFTIVLITGAIDIAGMLNIDGIELYLWVIPFLMVAGVLYSILDQWVNRLGQFGLKAASTSLTAIFVSSSKLIAGTISPSPLSLIITTNSASLMQTLALLSWKRLRNGIKLVPLSEWTTLIDSAKKYRDFPFFRAPEQFLDAVTQGIPILLFGALYGPMFTGHLALAITSLNTPANVVSKAIIDVVYPRLSRHSKEGLSLTPVLIRTTATTALLTAPPAVLLALYAPSAFSIVFGHEWLEAGQYAQWLSLWTFLMVCNRPAMAAIPVLLAQRWLLVYTIASTPLRAAAMFLAHIVYNDPMISVMAFSIMSTILNALLICGVFILSRVRVQN